MLRTLTIILEIAALLGIFAAAIVTQKKKLWNARRLAYAGLSLALSFLLSYIRLFRMPQGGSVTPGSMLPLLFFAAAYGVGPGVTVGLVYGLLQYLQGGWFLNPWQFILDYLLAYAALGLAGLYRKLGSKQLYTFYLAMLAGILARALAATLAGYMFWDTSLWPSLVYNGSYLVPETVLCMILALPLHDLVMKQLK